MLMFANAHISSLVYLCHFQLFLWYELKRMSFSKFVRNSIGVNKLNKVVV